MKSVGLGLIGLGTVGTGVVKIIKNGSELAKTYDIVNYPAFLAVDKDGKLLKLWPGMPMPRLDEFDSYWHNDQNSNSKNPLIYN